MVPKTNQDFIEMFKRRKWWIVICLLVSVGISYGFYSKLPKIYEATTLILVQPQEVPEDYIKPTVKSLVSDRLSTLSQQILSRTHLEKVIREFDLFSDAVGKVPMEGIVEAMRQSITIQVQRSGGRNVQNTFTISHAGKDPKKVMMVTNRLASLFIEENLRAREKQAAVTSDFIERELFAIEGALKEKEKETRNFKERHMGELPEQLDANLRILERLQDQLNNNSDALKTAEARGLMVREQISEFSNQGLSIGGDEITAGDPLLTRLTQLKARLSEFQSMYTEKHPDVIDTKSEIARLEGAIARQDRSSAGVSSEASISVLSPSVARLKRELAEVRLETRRLRLEGESLKRQIAMYESRVERTPKREQELATLTRDYDLLKANYQSLLDKKIQARMAENLERRQMGEQFKILDPARLPEKPSKPDRNRIMLIGAFLGLVFGGSLAYMKETTDQCFRKVEEMEDLLGLSVIAAIPRIEA